jgi:hypothetical protein
MAADSSLAEYVPPDTRILIGVQVRAIVDSDWGKTVIGQLKSASGDAWKKGMPITGFDPLKDVDELWVASTPADQKGPALTILRGRFDASLMPAAIGRYHTVALIPMDAKRQELLAIVDPSTLLVGDRFTVEQAIDRHGSKTAAVASLATAATELRARYWIWAVAERLDGIAATKNAPQGIQGVDGFEFGLSLNHDLEVVAQLRMRTAEEAQKMLGTIALLQMMVKSQQKVQSQTKIESRITGKTLNVSLQVPEEELKQAWEQQRAAIAQGLSQLPQQIAAARSGASSPFAGPPQLLAPTSTGHARTTQVTRESQIVNGDDGATMQLVLPGRR